MTLTSHRTRRLAFAGLASFAALGAAASSAQAAQTATLNYKCKFPLIGTQPLKLDITLDIPDTWPVGEPTEAFTITAKASAGGTTAQGLGLVEGLSVVGGVTEAQQPGKGTGSRARVELPDGSGVNVRVPIDVEPYTVVPPIPDPLVLNASGTTPSLTLDVPGEAKIVLTELILNLYGHYEDGTPVEGLTTPPTDIDRQPYTDIDGDPGTFNVPCKLDPAEQNLQLATFTLTDGAEPTTPEPTTPEPTTPEPTTPEPTTPEPTTPEPTTPEPTTPEPTTPEPTTPEPTTPEPTTPEPTTPEPTTPEPTTPEPTTPEPTTPEPTTPGGGVNYSYDLKGSTRINTGTWGKLPLTGGIDANLDLGSGDYTADLTLDPTQGKLRALGFLPVTAKVAFEPQGKTTGKFEDDTLTSTSKVKIKLPEIKLFGSIPLAGGANCGTKEPSQIDLKSKDGQFKALEGGKLSGKYKIGALTGCGGLNGLVSSLTAGGGNTIDVDLTPKAGQEG